MLKLLTLNMTIDELIDTHDLQYRRPSMSNNVTNS